MNKYEQFRIDLQRLHHKGEATLSLGEESYAVVYKINDIFILFMIPQYGGEESFILTSKDFEEVIKETEKWT